MNEWQPEGEPLEPVPAETETAPEYPFWSYLDLALFALLGLPSLLAATLATYLVFLVFGWHPSSRAPQLLGAQFLAYGLWFLALYLLLKLRYNRPFWKAMAWTLPRRGVLVSLLLGPALALAIAILGLLLQTPDTAMPIKQLLSDRLSILLVGFFAVTLGPLCEELAFRGFLLPLLVRSLGAVAGVFVAALPFALLHGPQYGWSWRHVLLITLAGATFGWVRYRTGSTLAAAAVHATYNLTFFLGYILQGKEVSW